MQTTSHFIGLKLKPEMFSNLFVRLQQALGENRDALEFQNILSVHITLLYLPSELSSNDQGKIQDIMRNLPVDSLQFGLNNFRYFGDIETPRLCYLVPNTQELTSWNALFKNAFPEYLYIPDNTYFVFIPHITLFKIRNMSFFNSFRTELEYIIDDELKKLSSVNIFEYVGLFAVNSQFFPEIQIEI